MSIKLKCYSVLLLTASISLSGCQTTEIVPPKTMPYPESTITLKAINDSDGDGVLDDIDESPQTLPNIVVDIKGCAVEVDVGGQPDIEMRNIFAPLSSQFLYSYDKEFAKIGEILNEYPDIRVLIFGHATSNELALLASDQLTNTVSLSRRRANAVENRLITKLNIASSRIKTYDCSDRYPLTQIDVQHNSLEDIESKGRQVILKANTRVKDLASIEHVGDRNEYENYIEYCPLF